MAFGNIYTFGPTFRAENSNTARHAAEFWMIEPEIAFADLDDNMQLAWDMIKHIVNHVLTTCKTELAFFNDFVDKTLLDRLNALAASDYEKVTYTEAVELLKKSGKDFKYPVEWGCDLQTEHERYLTEEIYKKPIFVIDYPKEIKSFYMRLNDDGKTVAAMDLLVPGVGEIIGGSQREERIDVLLKSGAEFKYPVYWGVDLQTEHERYLTEQVYKKPIFLIDYPKDIKAFYMRLNDDGKTVAAMDLLVPGVGEIIGGSQREERLDVLQARMAELNLSEEDYWWYLNLRKFGGTKHAGYGLGFERIIMYLTGVSNIRDVLPYPRTVGNAEY
jgi:aspartyl/asparaginyl-tRNA synthetase